MKLPIQEDIDRRIFHWIQLVHLEIVTHVLALDCRLRMASRQGEVRYNMSTYSGKQQTSGYYNVQNWSVT